MAGNINRWNNITADVLFRKNGTTTIWIWKHWNKLMVDNCSKKNSNWEIDDWMVRTEVKISMKKKYSACLYFKLLKLLKSVKNMGVSQPRWAIWREIRKWSCLPSILYCISRKTVDTEYTYYSWFMTSTDIVKWRKNEWLWKFWKRNDLYENFEKRGG